MVEIKEEFRARLEKALDYKDMKPAELAKATDISEATISQYRSGYSKPKDQRLVNIANALGVDPAWLMGLDVPMVHSATFNYEKYGLLKPTEKTLPIIGNVACGEPLLTAEEISFVTLEDVPRGADRILIAHGDSMINARILDGDYVFIHLQPEVNNGEIAAVLIDDEATLKRVYYDKESAAMTLVAENPAYAPMVYSGERLSQVKIIGKAIAFQSPVK